VRALDLHAERSAPQHGLAVSDADQVGQIRVALAELEHLDRPGRARDCVGEKRAQALGVEALLLADLVGHIDRWRRMHAAHIA